MKDWIQNLFSSKPKETQTIKLVPISQEEMEASQQETVNRAKDYLHALEAEKNLYAQEMLRLDKKQEQALSWASINIATKR